MSITDATPNSLAYGVRTCDGIILFDCGVGRDEAAIALRLAALGSPVTDIFLTHAHADHAGGAAAIRRLTGARLHAGAATAQIVASADERAMSLDAARRAGIYPATYRFSPCPVDQTLADGSAIRIGGVTVTCLATPGHCADHVSYLVEFQGFRALISGDALFAGGRVVLQDIWDCSVPDTCATIRKLAGYSFDSLLPGHGDFLMTDARRLVDVALDRIERLLVPELFL